MHTAKVVILSKYHRITSRYTPSVIIFRW